MRRDWPVSDTWLVRPPDTAWYAEVKTGDHRRNGPSALDGLLAEIQEETLARHPDWQARLDAFRACPERWHGKVGPYYRAPR